MGYWKLTTDCLYLLKKNWNTYYYDRVDALKFLLTRAEEDYRSEANSDLIHGRYTARSIQEWYDEKVYKAKKWAEDCMDSLNDNDKQFEKLWNEACEDYYDSSDYGYIIIYDFYKFEKRREYNATLAAEKKFRVHFSGQTHWYKLSGRRKDLEFNVPTPEFKKFE